MEVRREDVLASVEDNGSPRFRSRISYKPMADIDYHGRCVRITRNLRRQPPKYCQGQEGASRSPPRVWDHTTAARQCSVKIIGVVGYLERNLHCSSR